MIPVAEPELGEKEQEYVVDCIKSGWISSKGRYVEDFENGFANYCGCGYGVSTSNGTAALHLALSALGVGRGDEVIVPTFTFISTVNAVSYTGAKPVFVDAHPDYWCIDPESIEEKITDKTKAIIPVHLYGHPCDMDPIMELAEKHNLKIIEDAAEAHGAEYNGRKVGSFGIVNCFSFYGNKIITTGEGGMCLTDDVKLAEKMRSLRAHGMDPYRKYWYSHIGFNYRMTNLQAAVGLAQLSRLDEFVEIKRKNAALYNKLLKDVPGITTPAEKKWAKNVYWMYSILLDEDFSSTRDALMEKLLDAGIETRPLFYPVHEMPPYKNCGSYPISEEISKRGVSLPSSVKLRDEEIKEIVDTILG